MDIFLVGGAVRDRLLGQTPGDRDWVVVGATPAMLEALRRTLQRAGVRHTIVSAPLPASIRSLERIQRLSTLRNMAMRPLYDDVRMPISKVVWINDVLFTPHMLHHLVHTLNGTYDQACALDYFWLGFYDTWVLRDQYG